MILKDRLIFNRNILYCKYEYAEKSKNTIFDLIETFCIVNFC